MEKITEKIILLLLTLFMLLLGLVPLAAGQEIQLPRISIEELKALMEDGADIVIIDTQPKKLYEIEHIKGAISLPWAMKIDWTTAKKLPRDKLLILYCGCGPGEADSNHVGLQLKGMGFTHIKVLSDPSITGWIEKGYPIEK